jgi:hypothetical protein
MLSATHRAVQVFERASRRMMRTQRRSMQGKAAAIKIRTFPNLRLTEDFDILKPKYLRRRKTRHR